MSERINIRPTTSVYATYQRLSYRAWFAIAEFVDNSTQSYLDHREELKCAYRRESGPAQLRVEINYDSETNTLVVYDTAFGMEIEEFTRALVLDSPPSNRSGRSEFGMGLKTAACWFGTQWHLESTQLGSSRKLAATIDVVDLALHRSETIAVEETPTDPREHYTQLTISRVRHPIRGRTTGRVLDQLGSIYRHDLRSGEIHLLWNGEPVGFDEPPILTEAQIDGSVRVWKKPVSFVVNHPNGNVLLPVHGWIAIRNPAKQRDAGLVLLRRNRVIVGGPEEGYRPVEVFGQGNSFRYQRLIGELHMDAWPVTQAKDAFDWSDGLEDAFIEALKGNSQEYADYAEAYRSQAAAERITRLQMDTAATPTRRLFASVEFGQSIAEEATAPGSTASATAGSTEPLPVDVPAVSSGPISYTLNLGIATWRFRLHWQDQYSDAHWMQVSFPSDTDADIYLNTAHPFFAAYLGQTGIIEMLQKLVVALALAEQMARRTAPDGRIWPADLRNLMNRVLRRVAELEGTTNGS